jgi:HK97 family phage major capsid protein
MDATSANFTEARERLDQHRAKMNQVISEINELIAKGNDGKLTAGEKERLQNLEKGLSRLREEEKELKEQWQAIAKDWVLAHPEVFRQNAGDLYSARASDPARYVIDNAFKSRLLPAEAARVADELVTKSADPRARLLASDWVQTCGSPHYLSAFCKMLADPLRGHMLWTEQERQAVEYVKLFDSRYKGMTTGPGVGGELLPLVLDPSILLSSAGSINPLRRIARTVRTASNSWRGVSSEGVVAEWKLEEAQASEATPDLDEVEVPVHFGSCFIPYSFELGDDALDFAQQLGRILTDAADQLQAEAFVNGSGTNEPEGLITGLAGTSSEVDPETAETFAAKDVYGLQNALPPRFQANAAWVAALPTINTMAQFETTNGARLFPELGQGQLLRRPIFECSNMRSTEDIDPAKSEDNRLMVYGDFQHFVIADRIGSRLEVIPHLFGANQRPTGQRGAFLWFRCGSKVAVANAFRVLNVKTTA